MFGITLALALAASAPAAALKRARQDAPQAHAGPRGDPWPASGARRVCGPPDAPARPGTRRGFFVRGYRVLTLSLATLAARSRRGVLPRPSSLSKPSAGVPVTASARLSSPAR